MKTLLHRLFITLLGYAAAVASAGVMVAAFVFLMLAVQGQEWPSSGDAFKLLSVGSMILLLAAVIFLLPALLVIAVTEAYSIRRMAAYTWFGSIVLCVYGLGLEASSVASLGERISFVIAMTVGGTAAGFVYWKIAGLNAGRWRASVV